MGDVCLSGLVHACTACPSAGTISPSLLVIGGADDEEEEEDDDDNEEEAFSCAFRFRHALFRSLFAALFFAMCASLAVALVGTSVCCCVGCCVGAASPAGCSGLPLMPSALFLSFWASFRRRRLACSFSLFMASKVGSIMLKSTALALGNVR